MGNLDISSLFRLVEDKKFERFQTQIQETEAYILTQRVEFKQKDFSCFVGNILEFLCSKTNEHRLIEQVYSSFRQANYDFRGFQPTHYFAKYNNSDALISCVRYNPKTNVDAFTEFGDTPLHIAVKAGSYDVVKALMHLDADLTLRNKAGKCVRVLAKGRIKTMLEKHFSELDHRENVAKLVTQQNTLLERVQSMQHELKSEIRKLQMQVGCYERENARALVPMRDTRGQHCSHGDVRSLFIEEGYVTGFPSMEFLTRGRYMP